MNENDDKRIQERAEGLAENLLKDLSYKEISQYINLLKSSIKKRISDEMFELSRKSNDIKNAYNKLDDLLIDFD